MALAAAVAEDDIRGHSLVILCEVALITHKAGFFCVLEVEPMSFCYLAIDCLLDPVYVIDYLVAPLLLHDVHSPLELRIDDPDEQKSLLLKQRDWDVLNGLVAETGVLNGHAS